MKKYFKDRANLKVALELMWQLTPSPNCAKEAIVKAAQAEHRHKSLVTIQVLARNANSPKSWLRAEIEKKLGLDVAWCQLAIAETIRWAITQGASLSDVSAVVAAVAPIPVGKHKRRKRVAELTEKIITTQGINLGAALSVLAATIEIHALLAPEFDISNTEQLGVVVSDSISTDAMISAGVRMSLVMFCFGVTFVVWAFVTWAIAELFNIFGALILGSALGFQLGKLITRGAPTLLAKEVTKTFALWQVSRELLRAPF
ncbi:hypothetical protein [Rhodoferax sp. TS-BS-61-7]|uniref:hypothetical protein n=1 Tax=Rhodoferax sp. TS-BS-61-7 TaxID=2094194 RepID=UPI000CF6AB50|nr:hypothetical protein [Rhodoferax sp. TS-BS-61-7]PQA78058.1 hypothetical protein C5F53_06905 [Rhodoferax sp. TS-BS-61-7]